MTDTCSITPLPCLFLPSSNLRWLHLDHCKQAQIMAASKLSTKPPISVPTQQESHRYLLLEKDSVIGIATIEIFKHRFVKAFAQIFIPEQNDVELESAKAIPSLLSASFSFYKLDAIRVIYNFSLADRKFLSLREKTIYIFTDYKLTSIISHDLDRASWLENSYFDEIKRRYSYFEKRAEKIERKIKRPPSRRPRVD